MTVFNFQSQPRVRKRYSPILFFGRKLSMIKDRFKIFRVISPMQFFWTAIHDDKRSLIFGIISFLQNCNMAGGGLQNLRS